LFHIADVSSNRKRLRNNGSWLIPEINLNLRVWFFCFHQDSSTAEAVIMLISQSVLRFSACPILSTQAIIVNKHAVSRITQTPIYKEAVLLQKLTILPDKYCTSNTIV